MRKVFNILITALLYTMKTKVQTGGRPESEKGGQDVKVVAQRGWLPDVMC